MTTTPEVRQPTVQELINSMVRILIAYHLLVEGKEQVKGFEDMLILRGLVAMASSIPVASVIESDPLLVQYKEEVYEMLAKMIESGWE